MCFFNIEVHICTQVNPGLAEKFEEKGMKFVGRSEDGERMEIMELKGLFFLGISFIS